jgi:muramoyltetrapeptide carboxypeptidase
MDLIVPPYLKEGDTIGVIAPARKVLPEEMEPFRLLMESKGFRVAFGKNLFGSENQYSGTVQERLDDLNAMINEDTVKAIVAARGGYGCAHLLPGMDLEKVVRHPKWFIGFSDMTAIHSHLGRTMESIHGVMPYSLEMDEPQNAQSFDYLVRVLKGEKIRYTIPRADFNLHGEVTARLTGGNLSVLYSLSGTPYEPDYEGALLFLEDLDEYLYHIDRMILNMDQKDIFRKIAGLIIGDFSDMHDNTIPFGKNALEIIAGMVEKYRIPTLFGFPAGHKISNFPLIFGRESTLTIGASESTLRMY